jgi:hypothetical protein
MNRTLLLFFILISFAGLSQQTRVYGIVKDGATGEILPYVKVQFLDSKIGTITDTAGYFNIETYYATDSLQFSFYGYQTKRIKVQKDKTQEINIILTILSQDLEEVVVLPPDEFPSTTLHKKVIAHKDINNKEKLSSYEYEVYNKIQLDMNNIGDKFTDIGLVKKLDLVMDYLDSADNGKNYLPMLLSETISDFYFKNNPKKKRETIKGTHITGVDNLQVNQLLGDMYLDINVYDNNINLLSRSFVSPVSNIARTYYRFYLEDSTFIDNQWCYKLRFTPKRSGDMTFEGEMWIHDTTYAVKRFSASISPSANINYVQDLYFEHHFEMVQPEVWMLTKEKMIVDLKITKKTGIYGFYARKLSSRKYFRINEERPSEFYNSDFTVEFQDSAKVRDEQFWIKHRHEPLNEQETGIKEMIDSLQQVPLFKTLKNLSYFATTGYYPIGKIEIGNAFALVSYNEVENFRSALALRTSNNFSRRFEIGGKVAYGFGDERFKYGGSIRYNITPKKRGMLVGYYNYDIEQIGQSPTAATVGSTFGTILRTGPLDKLTFVEKAGINLEKDIKKDIILYGGFEWKEFTPLGITPYVKLNSSGGVDTIGSIRTSEFIARFRWTKDEEFIGGSFDRSSLRSRYPIFSIQGIFGVKGLLGADYNYQKLEFQMEHNKLIGPMGRMRYGVNAGYIFGTAAYPFLKVHEGNESFWLLTSTFNKLDFFEFISDRYVGGFIENHWEGLFFDRIPLIKKLKWRLVTTGRITYGSISERHSQEMSLPSFTKQFGKIPYAEVAVGIENIFKVGRVDVVYRLTHNAPDTKFINHLAVRARFSLVF